VRIAYAVTRADAVGGATEHVREMARAMLARGHEAAIFVGGASGQAFDRLVESGAPVRGLRFLRRAVRPDRDVAAFVEMKAALAGFQPDVVSAHTAKAGWIARAACARLRIPCIYTPHGLPVGDRMPGASGAVFRAAERAASRWMRAMICVCEHERKLAAANAIAPPERLFVVRNGVRPITGELLADPGASPPRIVCVARFEPPKDHATLLRALAQITDLDWELDLIGDGPMEPACRDLAERLGIARRVRFRGYMRDVAAALAQAQVFALASNSEGLPRSVLEAMRAGLPSAASSVGGVPEALHDGETGLLAPSGDAAGFAAALRRLISDATLRLRIGAAARAVCEARFSLQRMIEETAAVYEFAVRDRKAFGPGISPPRHGGTEK
jgi:glycosyltransferase involved in cell wall biosynthesis